MKHYITLYEDKFSQEDCQDLIRQFESHSAYHDLQKKDAKDGWSMSFTQLHFSNHKEFQEVDQKLRELFLQAIFAYREEHNIEPHQWPKRFQLEPIRMKRYMPNTKDHFDTHVEVTSLETAKRFMVVLLYLNEDFIGGETDFTQLKVKVKPKQGSIVLFPATWNWLHKGCPVSGENPKYIVGSLMHYV
ncbi:MAG: 2OG-Fe(II) oxygenase [Epsilonproteobacteria bacterium]|nr:2OG-Fe(II) oxygenase [Campylobacterota bacterium]